MKNILRAGFTVFAFAISIHSLLASGWSVAMKPQQVFIENKGQFDNLNGAAQGHVLFATENYANQVLFTSQGVTYRLEERVKPTKEEQEEREREMKRDLKEGKQLSHQEMEREEHRMIIRRDAVSMEWVGANANVQVQAFDAVENYFNYGMGSKSIDRVKGYQKLVYQNLYPNIDVEYIFHPEGGIEYSFILHPGADASQIKMRYSKVRSSAKGDLLLPTIFGNIIEHAPKTFYASDKKSIASQFTRSGKEVTLSVAAYDKSQTVVIDPWVQTPAFNTQWDCVWECEKDSVGNAYLIGGVMAMQLLKYNAAGTLQWTYTTPYDTSNNWLGTFATDKAGNSYVTSGSIAAIQKINTNGGLVWNNPNPGGIFSTSEFWSIAFNWDQTQLVIGGTGGTILPPLPYIYHVDMSSGNVTNSLQITGGQLFPTQEVRAIAACSNGRYYYMTHDSIGFFNENQALCGRPSYYVNSTYSLGYKCENFRVNNTGIAALRTFGTYAYVNIGNQIHKRSITTGAIVATATIPGGARTTSFGSTFVENSGIDIDACGNIYVGSRNQIVKFDANLTQLATYPTTYNVYDVHVSTGGNIIACGSSGTSSSGTRVGYLESISVGACAPITSQMCEANICPAGPFCTSDAPVTLTSAVPGGTWSGTGITNASTGTFSPSVAGAGTFYIRNTIGCGSDSMPITVNACAALQACLEQNGNITVSNGTSPYTWQSQSTSTDCSGCPLGICIPPLCNGTVVTTWTTFATGATATPPGTWPIRVRDNSSNELVFNSTAGLVACSACTLTASASSTNATCGSNNGSATVTAGGGTPTAYSWSSGATTATASNLAPGTYTVTVTASGCTATASATVVATGAVSLTSSSTNAGCGVNNGSATVNATGGNGTFAYAWSNGGNTATISNLGSGSYTVTVTSNGCTATASVTVSSPNGVNLTPSSTNAGCSPTGSATVAASGGNGTFTYSWSNGGTTATISNLTAGTYSVTVSSAGCSATSSITVGSSGSVTTSTTSTNAGCTPTGSATVTPSGGTGSFTYLWSNGGTTTTISNLAGGTYTVTVTSASCTATASIVVGSTGSVSATTSTTNAGCTSTGSATVTPSGGTGSFTYLWSNGGTNATISNLSGGSYAVTVSSGNCTTVTAAVVVSSGGVTLVPSTTATTCASNNGSAAITATTGLSPFTYLWNNGGTTSSITNVAGGTYIVTVTDANGCTATMTAHVDSSVVVPATLVSDKLIMCSGDSAYICVQGNYTNIVWNFGPTTQCVYTKLAGNYYVSAKDSNNCTVGSNRISLGVYPLPPVSVSVNGDTLRAYNAVTYQWFRNSTPIPGATSSLYIATQSGDYTVAVTDSNGCHAVSSKITIITTGLETLKEDLHVRVYPNPLEFGIWTLEVGENLIGSEVEIFDAEGRLVYKSEIRNAKSELILSVASGVYMMRINSPYSTLTHKLIKL